MTNKKQSNNVIQPNSGFKLGGNGSSSKASADEIRERRLAALAAGQEESTTTTATTDNKKPIDKAETDDITSTTTPKLSEEEKSNQNLEKEDRKPPAVPKEKVKPPTMNDEKAFSSQQKTLPSSGKPLTDDWRSWLRINLARGCDQQVLYDKCVIDQGFRKEEVLEALEDETVRQTLQLDAEHPKPKEMDPEGLKEQLPATIRNSVPLNNGWKEWIRVKLDQGNSKEDVFFKCWKENLNLDQVSQALGGYRARPAEIPVPTEQHPFFKRTFQPRAWKLDTDLAQVYEIPNFLTAEECRQVIQRIDNGILQRSMVTDGNADSRTSHTCHLRLQDDDDDDGIVARVERKFQSLLGDRDPTKAETLQGQRYGVGQYFHAHTDWFSPNSLEYEKHCTRGGQRTWTVMVYLNLVEEGGGTKFVHLEREFVPTPGLALAWNNLDADGVTPNPWTLHEAMPVTKGVKYVLTKWFRERSMAE
jgi:prolyl 4-hydroxylase